MSSVVVSGDTSGAITISAPAISGTNTLTLPAVTDTLVGLAATQTLTNKTLTTPNLGTPSTLVLTNATGLAAAAMPAGSVLQVVSTHYTGTVSSSSATPTDVSGFSVNITPSSASNKVLVMVHTVFGFDNSDPYPYILCLRDSTSIGLGVNATGNQINVFLNGPNLPGTASISHYKSVAASKTFLDSPSTTSAVTYKIQIANGFTGTGYLNRQAITDNQGYIQSTSSTITVMEIKG